MKLTYLLFPLIGGLIGWLTNLVAVKMLFYPYKPVEIPGIGWRIQGLIPKRQPLLAEVIGQVVEKELLSVEEIILHLREHVGEEKIIRTVSSSIRSRVMTKIPPFIPSALREGLGDLIQESISKEAPRFIEDVFNQVENNLIQDLRIGKLVEDKVKSLSMIELEELVLKIASKELKHIEILGAVLGFIIGAFQILIVVYS